jgi:hypothetical protein
MPGERRVAMKAWVSFAVVALAVPVLTGAARSATAPGAPRAACAWRVAASGGPAGATLDAVAATSATDAWAVGSYDDAGAYRSLTEHWDGKSWQVVPSPNPAAGTHTTNALAAVVAISKTNAWAFGFYEKRTTSFRTLIEHWNGSHWSVVPSPNSGPRENTLSAAAAISAGNIWAVGYRGGPGPRKALLEHWNGAQWSIVTSPNPGTPRTSTFLSAIAVDPFRQAWVVGSDSRSFGQTVGLVRRGNGWSIVPTANPGDGDRFLFGVTASLRVVLAVGSYLAGQQTRALGEQWNGARWVQVPAASTGADYNSLQAVAAKSALNAWAVGTSRASRGGRFRALAERWTGAKWVAGLTPDPGAGDDSLNGVTAIAGGGYWAVGSAGSRTLIERYC